MQVHCDEGVANHIGPVPCADVREGLGEASVGDRIGQPLSREIDVILGADAVPLAEGNTDGCAIASARPARRGLRPWHVRTLLFAARYRTPLLERCPARALLARVPLGPRPSLHYLRGRLPGFVRRLLRYYDGV